ncbi:MAG: hypothetical protein HY905_25570 [Deltaproteobacteria bacterium]|nr:hypothetical protein [Deltaproteobacteria bacterium]
MNERRAAIPAKTLLGLTSCLLAACCPSTTNPAPAGHPQEEHVAIDDAALESTAQALIREHGEGEAERIRRGLRQVAERWWTEDGDAAALGTFAAGQFVSETEALADTARHLEYAMEMLDGHFLEADREISRFQDLDEGPMRPIDELLAAYGPGAHVLEDLFQNRIAFVVLLNFPLTTLEQRLADGPTWSRDTWALARLAQRFEFRLPATVIQGIDAASSAASRYIDAYNIRMDRLRRGEVSPGFPEGTRLISHWGLRDEIRAQYAQEGGLERQRLIAKVMERIVRQEIPAEVIDSDTVEWDPETNLVRAVGETAWREGAREADERYAQLLAVFRANREADRWFPSLPTHIARSFERDREMPEARVRSMLEAVLGSPVARRVATLVQQRLGRPLEPFDLWYTGFRVGGSVDEEALSVETRAKYPTADAFRADLPRILGDLGFTPEKAEFLASHIVVEPSRGPGEAIGAGRRDDNAHLRTRLGAGGMDYKGYNIAVHEMGHTVEQVFSVTAIDHTLLQGVPNTAFTEAFAFLFQARDLQLLGRPMPDADQVTAWRALQRFWDAFEISGVALLDLEIWHWMYDHPDATPAELREAMVAAARELWNRWYAPVFGVQDSVLPAIYSHIIAFGLYTPDYPMGFLITGQIEAWMHGKNLAEEMERMCRQGRLAPDVWMQGAVGAPVSADGVLEAAEAALAVVGE